MHKKTLWISCFLGMLMALPSFALAKKYTLRIATLAPKGSSWVKVLNAFRWEVKKKSKGKLRIKLYTGGRMGDEKVVVRKIKLDSLQGGVITSIGLSQINTALMALQLPFMFRKYKELYHVRKVLDAHLRKQLSDKGFILLGWGDLGYVYLFSKKKLRNIADLKKAKIWAWTDDPLTKQFASQGNLTPRLLGLLHVRQGLQTGTVDTVVGTPLTLIAMQWHSYIKYRIKYKFAIGIGATVISKKSYDRLPANLQKILMKTSAKYHKIIARVVRRDNRRAMRTLRKRGIKSIKLNKKQKQKMREIAAKVTQYFTGKLYSAKDLNLIKNTLKKYRGK